MARKYFGTDGVRGQVGKDPMTARFAFALGNAAGVYLRSHLSGQKPAVVIGRDTRRSGEMLQSALLAGLTSAGVDVWLAGILPTPAVAYVSRTYGANAGIVISASHNPFEDNGIKFFAGSGEKFPESAEEAIESHLEDEPVTVPVTELGVVKLIPQGEADYGAYCCRLSGVKDLLAGLALYVDAANGAAYKVAHEVFDKLGARVVMDANTPDGLNINDGVGATHVENLPARVAAAGCDYGIALDGDADRLIMADREKVYDGDELLYVLIKSRLAQGPLSGVVGTLMTNFGLEKRLSELSIPFVRAKVGDKYVLEALKERDWLLGAENSGHILILDKQTTGDGIVSAIEILKALVLSGKSLKTMTSDLKMLPQVLVNKRIEKGFDWQHDAGLSDAISKVKAQLGAKGRVLVRASGTEPLLRLMVECEDIALARALADKMADSIGS